MAQVKEEIIAKWAEGKAAREFEQPPYSAMIQYATEIKFLGHWEWTKELDPTDHKSLDVAKTIEFQSIGVKGEYLSKYLKKQIMYEVQFVVKVTEEVREKFPVLLQLTRLDGTEEKHIEDLNKKTRNTWVGLKVGEFFNPDDAIKSNGDLIFSLKSGNHGQLLKKGLTVIGVVIVPII